MKKVLVIAAVFSLIFLSIQHAPISAEEIEGRTWQDETIYFIMVDRFNNGNFNNDFEVHPDDPYAYHGGDLKGIIKRLDDLKELGFTAIWLTPIMDNEEKGYHGYWISDFQNVEEHFGTLEDAKRLVQEAHKRDIKVILDFVVNHTGYNHPWLNDPEKKDWFHQEASILSSNQENLEKGWLAGLPDLAQENPEVEQYLLDTAEFWITELGIDGFRLDTVKHVPKSFWEKFVDHVKSLDPDFYLLGEVWSSNPKYIAEYEQTGIDSFVNYPMYETLVNTFKHPGQSLDVLYTVWKRNETFLERPELLGNFIDNHDNKRFIRIAIENQQHPRTRLKLALTYLYTAPGIPVIYQGTEIPMDGGEDPDNRRMVNFAAQDEELRNHIKRLGELRQTNPALRRGDYEQVIQDGAFSVFKRTYQDQSMFIAINNDTELKVASIPGLPDGLQLQGLLHEDLVKQTNQGEYKIAIKPETSEIYLVEQEEGINWLLPGLIVVVFGGFALFVFYVSRMQKKE